MFMKRSFRRISGILLILMMLCPNTVYADVGEIQISDDIPLEIGDTDGILTTGDGEDMLSAETDTAQVLPETDDDPNEGLGAAGAFGADDAGSGKSTVRLSRTTLKLKKGKTTVLKLNGVSKKAKVTWSAGKKGIVRLENDKKSECKVIAKKTGTVWVRAKYRDKTYKCKVTVTKNDTIKFGGKKYKLTYADEFNTFNKKRWAYCPEQERQDAGGEWRNSCTKVKNGKLVITCKVDKDGTPISGAIRSTKDYEQTYGLYHIRFKPEKADGLWYALWLLSDGMDDSTIGHGATDGAELDMIELVPHTGELCMSVHWDGYGKHLKSYCETDRKLTKKKDFYNRYHDLWYLWDKHGYRLYMDGTDKDSLIFDFDGKKHGDGTCAVPCDLIISAEFGKWGGKIKKARLPSHFYIDYVRVYKEM